eukprot:2544497-Pyramimonas_sp.AAC.1
MDGLRTDPLAVEGLSEVAVDPVKEVESAVPPARCGSRQNTQTRLSAKQIGSSSWVVVQSAGVMNYELSPHASSFRQVRHLATMVHSPEHRKNDLCALSVNGCLRIDATRTHEHNLLTLVSLHRYYGKQ